MLIISKWFKFTFLSSALYKHTWTLYHLIRALIFTFLCLDLLKSKNKTSHKKFQSKTEILPITLYK